MLVRYWMNTNPVSVHADDAMKSAMDLLNTHKFHMLPVLDDNRLVGVVTGQDLKRAKTAIASTMDCYDYSEIYLEIKVRSFMSMELVSVSWDLSIEEAAEVLLGSGISGAPVVDDAGNLVGVITKTDLFKALISLTGLKKRGVQFGMIVEDKLGATRELIKTISQYGGKIACVLTSYERAPQGYRRVYLRMYGVDRLKLSEIKKILGSRARLLYMLDHREGHREIY